MADEKHIPQAGRRRLIAPHPIARTGAEAPDAGLAPMAQLDDHTVLMMGDNPALPPMPARPTLIDFLRGRVEPFTRQHLLSSAKHALGDGQDEKIVLACLLHDIANGCFVRTDHGYWGEQMIAPYVSEEIAWAVRMHQPLRYFADETAGYAYPESYIRFFGADYEPPEYIRQEAETARRHRWYMSARLVTIYDHYLFANEAEIDPAMFEDIVGRHFKQPEDGLGFDNSPSAHVWRTVLWPNNFL